MVSALCSSINPSCVQFDNNLANSLIFRNLVPSHDPRHACPTSRRNSRSLLRGEDPGGRPRCSSNLKQESEGVGKESRYAFSGFSFSLNTCSLPNSVYSYVLFLYLIIPNVFTRVIWGQGTSRITSRRAAARVPEIKVIFHSPLCEPAVCRLETNGPDFTADFPK